MVDKAMEVQLPADKSLTGIFTDQSSAEHAYQMMRDLGYSEGEINVLMSDEARLRYFPSPGLKGELVGNDIKEGPGLGGVVGAGTGTALGAILGVAVSLALPGFGLVVAGPLASALTGAAVGGLSGGMLGSLLGVGIPEKDARAYEEKIKQGNILIAVNPHSEEDAENIAQEWRNAGGEVILGSHMINRA